VKQKYLIEVDNQARENETLRRFCESPFMLDELLALLGLPAGLYWATLGLPHGDLIAGRKGDVDLMAGRLAIEDLQALEPLKAKYQADAPKLAECQHIYFAALELAAAGGLAWPPPMDNLVAIEVKCAYFDADQLRVKARHSRTRDLRLQIAEFLEFMPFDRVALLDFIINPPADGPAGGAWINAAATAAYSFHDMRPTLETRLPPDSPAGHFAMPWGAVAGADESWRGTGSPIQLRAATGNPRLGEVAVRERRNELNDNLSQILAHWSRPLTFPAILS
jgi:hypothetical protein